MDVVQNESSRKKAEDEFDDFYSDLDNNNDNLVMIQVKPITPVAASNYNNDMQLKDLSESHASIPEIQVATNNSDFKKRLDLSSDLLPNTSKFIPSTAPLYSSLQAKPTAIEKALQIAFKPRTEMTFGDFNELIPKPLQMSTNSKEESLAESYTLSASQLSKTNTPHTLKGYQILSQTAVKRQDTQSVLLCLIYSKIQREESIKKMFLKWRFMSTTDAFKSKFQNAS
jgi:hypothetical protein